VIGIEWEYLRRRTNGQLPLRLRIETGDPPGAQVPGTAPIRRSDELQFWL
jgi:hypothetical protein